MAGGNRSKNHHWWPVALQSYWADSGGDVSWIDPDGKREKKRFENRKIGAKRHGHTMLRGNEGWETNFESEFDIDDRIHKIVSGLKRLKPLGYMFSDWPNLFRAQFKKKREPQDASKLYNLDDDLHRDLLLLIYSLIIRSPASRSKFERYPEMAGLPPNEDVGKANMHSLYRTAKDLCEKGHISLHYVVLLHSPYHRFVCGDGYLDWLSTELIARRISGRALIPLTPKICVYFCTRSSARTSSPNCASLMAPKWMVEWVNYITQIYSRDRLFFRGKPPRLTDHFRKRLFLELGDRKDPLIDTLDEIAGNRRENRFISFGR